MTVARGRQRLGAALEHGGGRVARLGYLLTLPDGLALRGARIDARTVHGLRAACGPSREPSTIFDVGAHRGGFLRTARAAFPSATIHCFEPVASSFAELRRSASHLGGDVHIHRVALGADDGEAVINVNDFSAASSIFGISPLQVAAFPETGVSQSQETVPCVRLDSWAMQRDLHRPILLKMDVQGAELEVLTGASGVLSQIDFIFAELSVAPMYERAPLFADVIGALAEHGFHLWEFGRGLRSPTDGRLLQIDAFFLARPAATAS